MADSNYLSSRVDGAKSLDFGSIFNNCIELFKKTWVQGLVVLLLTGVLIIPFYIIVYLPLIGLGVFSPDSFGGNQGFSDLDELGVLVVILSIVLFVFMILGVVTITTGLKAAYFRIVKNKDLKLNQSDDYFFFLKKRYLKKTIVLSLMMSGIGLLAALLFVLPIIYAMIPLSYMVVVYAFNPELSPSEIVKIGFRLGNKKWLITFGLAVLAWFLSTVIGFLMCFVGIYVTQQFVNLPFYQIYKESIRFDELNVIDEIGTSSE